MAQTLTEIKAILAAHGLHPKHKFGQNFLHDGNHMGRIMDAAALSAGDVVLEVGPGTGALTERLLEADVSVVAVEIDGDLEPILRERILGLGDHAAARFALVIDDVMAGKHGLNGEVQEALSGQTGVSERGFKLIANLPYNVASPLLINLAKLASGSSTGAMIHAVVMLQKEVAQRIVAPPGGKDYGPLGILLQALYDTRLVGTLSPHCFWPAPKVASAVVAMVRRASPLTPNFEGFTDLTHRLFAARRKQLGSILGQHVKLPKGIEPRQRPETLSVEQIAELLALNPESFQRRP
ncbi:MAG: 16S rRNA (adenine(1518)-N(6)/adenine(1519)-N(6))-dimethyltransferase RsmA [Planctomycetota bacterium]